MTQPHAKPLPAPSWPDGAMVYPRPDKRPVGEQLIVCYRCGNAVFVPFDGTHAVTCEVCQETVFLHSLLIKNLLFEGDRYATHQIRN